MPRVVNGELGGVLVTRGDFEEAMLAFLRARTDDPVAAQTPPGRAALYARKKDEFFRRLDGGIANIAYSPDRIWKRQVKKP